MKLLVLTLLLVNNIGFSAEFINCSDELGNTVSAYHEGDTYKNIVIVNNDEEYSDDNIYEKPVSVNITTVIEDQFHLNSVFLAKVSYSFKNYSGSGIHDIGETQTISLNNIDMICKARTDICSVVECD